jgi:transcriptional regulator with XRE-family HTH domain
LPDGQKLPSSDAANIAESKPVQRRELAKALGITHQAVTKLVKRGMPTHSVEAAREYYNALESKPADYASAKLQKTLREIERLDLIVARERGELINRAEVREAGVAIGALLSAELAAAVNDLCGQVAGVDEATARQMLEARADSLLESVQKKLNESTL